MNFIRRKLREKESGQGLVEYALILSLVAVVCVVALAIFGDQLAQTLCKVVWALDASAKLPTCERINVSCGGVSVSGGYVSVEATVSDTIGDDNVDRVVFYVDGVVRHTESVPKYCFGAGDGSCGSRSLSSGTHTIRAVAFDAEGNSGYCEVTVNVP